MPSRASQLCSSRERVQMCELSRPTDPKLGDKPAGNDAPAPREREVSSEELLGADRVLVIRHDGQRYRLIVTRNGRLMLQK